VGKVHSEKEKKAQFRKTGKSQKEKKRAIIIWNKTQKSLSGKGRRKNRNSPLGKKGREGDDNP